MSLFLRNLESQGLGSQMVTLVSGEKAAAAIKSKVAEAAAAGGGNPGGLIVTTGGASTPGTPGTPNTVEKRNVAEILASLSGLVPDPVATATAATATAAKGEPKAQQTTKVKLTKCSLFTTPENFLAPTDPFMPLLSTDDLRCQDRDRPDGRQEHLRRLHSGGGGDPGDDHDLGVRGGDDQGGAVHPLVERVGPRRPRGARASDGHRPPSHTGTYSVSWPIAA